MSTPLPIMTAASVKPTSLRIRDLLDSRYPARVPRYQRGYAWEEEHVNDFVEDIRRLLTRKSGEVGHFYGGMVAISVSDTTEPRGSYFEVVDGQQRLATFCLVLAELAKKADDLRVAAERAGQNDDASKFAVYARQIRESYLYFRKYDVEKGSEEPEPRLRLSEVDDQVFQAILAGQPYKPTRKSHERLIEAARIIREKLIDKEIDETSFDAARQSLVRLHNAVLYDSFVIHIVSDTRSSGYRLFAVLNDRGAGLTVADLLRSHTLELLDSFDELRERTAALWDDIFVSGGKEVDRFLAVYYVSLVGKRSKVEDLFDSVRTLLFPEMPATHTHANQLYEKLQSLYEALLQYRDIRSATWPFPPAKKDRPATVGDWDRSRLDRLVNTLRHDLADPLLLAARYHGDEAAFADLVHLIELFAFRYKNICNGHTAPASAAYYKECKRLRALPRGSKLEWSSLRKDLRNLINMRASDDVFRTSLKSKLSYDSSSSRSNIRELLSLLEDYRGWLLSGGVGTPKPGKLVSYDLSRASIEHIYPQNPGLPDPEMAPHVHRLGNLSYWSPDDNAAAGNEDFSTKRPLYAASSVGLNQDLAKLQSWGLAELEKREAKILADACRVIRV